MLDQERREHLLLVIDRVTEVHAEWAESDEPHVTHDLETAVEDLIEVAGYGEIPGDCRQVIQRIEEVGVQWQAWKDQVASTGGAVLAPGNGFWQALESLQDARQAAVQREETILETIDELTKQKVSDRQICTIYGWVSSDGSPQFNKLREERADPGKHTGEKFVSPLEKERQLQVAKVQETVARVRRSREAKLTRLKTVAPEEIVDLVLAGVSGYQVADMKQVTINEVYEACDAAGVDRPPEHYTSVHASRAPQEPELSESVERMMDAREGKKEVPEEYGKTESLPGSEAGMMTEEQHIVFCKRQNPNMTAGEIAMAVSSEEKTVTAMRVGKVLARHKRQPEAFAAVG